MESQVTAPLFTFLRFNARRAMRGAEAAELEITWPDGQMEVLWMSYNDIKNNMLKFGSQAGLEQAMKAYSDA